MYKKFANKIALFDTFGAEVKLNFHHRQTHQSPFGGFITILLFCALCIIFIRGTISLVKEETYTVTQTQLVNVDPPRSEMNTNNFMIGLNIEIPTINGTQKQIFSYSVSLVQNVIDQNGTYNKTQITKQPLEQCTESHFIGFDDSTTYNNILKQQLSNYFCLPKNYSFEIRGTYNSDNFTYAKVMIEICTSSDCYTTEELQSLQDQGYFANGLKINTIMQNSVPELNSQSNYLSYLYSDYYIIGQMGYESKANIYLSKCQIIVDNSIIPGIQNIQKNTLYQLVENKLQNPILNKTLNNNFASFYIRLSQNNNQYKKELYRFDQLISYVGGITKFIVTIIGYFILKYNQTGLYIKLANSLYQFDIPENKKGEVVYSFQFLVDRVLQSIKSVQAVVDKFKHGANKAMQLSKAARSFRFMDSKFANTTPQPNQTSFVNTTPLQTLENDKKNDSLIGVLHGHNTQRVVHFVDDNNNNLKSQRQLEYEEMSLTQIQSLDHDKNKFLEQIIQTILSSKKALSYGLKFLMKQFSNTLKNSQSNYQSQLFEKSRQMILRDMDILVVMSKLQEIEKFKHVLLNKTQRKVFNYLPKPIVFINQEIKQFDETNYDTDLLKIRKSMLMHHSKSLLGGREKFNTDNKLRKLYDAYEEISFSTTYQENEREINHRLIDLVEPVLQFSFNSLIEMEKLNRSIKDKKQKRVFVNSLPSVQTQQIIDYDQEENKKEEIKQEENKLISKQRTATRNSIRVNNRKQKDIILTQIESKSNLIDVELLSQ